MSARATSPGLSPLAAGVLTFVATASVLVLEIAAARLLAPYVGVSLTTYTAIIGVILAGIALGAWLGGRVADRVSPAAALGPTFVLGGLASIVAVPAVAVVGDLGLGADPVAVVALATIGFVGPAAVLSAVGPMVVRATLVDVTTSGALVGRLSAIGTLGALTGTFATGFVLLGAFPTRTIVLGTGGLLVVVGIALALRRAGRMAMLALPAGGALLTVAGVAADPCQRESRYYCLTVVADRDDPSGRTLVLDRVRHAYVDLDDPTRLEFRYVRWFADATADLVETRGGRVDVLHLGGGGFSFPRYLVATAPASRHVVLELDPEVLATARRELAFAPSARVDVRLGDARLGIRTVGDAAVDLVVGDAFGSLSVPWHLTTREFLGEVERTLRPEGRYVMNLIDGPRLGFARAEAATLRSIWEHVAVIGTSSALAGRSGGNIVLVASHVRLDLDALRRRVEATGEGGRIIAGGAELDAFTAGAPILTDDFAPVDQLLLP